MPLLLGMAIGLRKNSAGAAGGLILEDLVTFLSRRFCPRKLALAAALVFCFPAPTLAQGGDSLQDAYIVRELGPAGPDCVERAKAAFARSGLRWVANAWSEVTREAVVTGRESNTAVTVYCSEGAPASLVATRRGGSRVELDGVVAIFANLFGQDVQSAEIANPVLVAGQTLRGTTRDAAYHGDVGRCPSESPLAFARAGFRVVQDSFNNRLFAALSPQRDLFVVIDCHSFARADGYIAVRIRYFTTQNDEDRLALISQFERHFPMVDQYWEKPTFRFTTNGDHVRCIGSNISGRWAGETFISCYGKMGYVWGAQGRGEGFFCSLAEGCQPSWEDYIRWSEGYQASEYRGQETEIIGDDQSPVRCAVHKYQVNCFMKGSGIVVSAQNFGYQLLASP